LSNSLALLNDDPAPGENGDACPCRVLYSQSSANCFSQQARCVSKLGSHLAAAFHSSLFTRLPFAAIPPHNVALSQFTSPCQLLLPGCETGLDRDLLTTPKWTTLINVVPGQRCPFRRCQQGIAAGIPGPCGAAAGLSQYWHHSVLREKEGGKE
jgi:hypothetical protein